MRPPSHTPPARRAPAAVLGLCRYTGTSARPRAAGTPSRPRAAPGGGHGAGPPRCLAGQLGPDSAAARGTPVRVPSAGIPLEGGGWAVSLLPSGMQAQARQLVLDLLAGYGPGSASGVEACTVVRVPAGAMDPRLGPAVLHHRRGQTAVYCPADHITPKAAALLAAFVSRTADLLGRAGPAGGGPTVAVVRRSHREFAALHPAVAVARNGHMTAYVCAGEITAGLAYTLGVLWRGLCRIPDASAGIQAAAGGTCRPRQAGRGQP